MKTIARSILLCALFTATALFVRAQATEEAGTDNTGTEFTGDDTASPENPGVASYNVDGYSEDAPDTETDGSWREETGYLQKTETIHIYSGHQDGNNVVRTEQVPVPDEADLVDGGYQAH